MKGLKQLQINCVYEETVILWHKKDASISIKYHKNAELCDSRGKKI